MSDKYAETKNVFDTSDIETIKQLEQDSMLIEKIELIKEVKEINSKLMWIEQDVKDIKEHLLENV